MILQGFREPVWVFSPCCRRNAFSAAKSVPASINFGDARCQNSLTLPARRSGKADLAVRESRTDGEAVLEKLARWWSKSVLGGANFVPQESVRRGRRPCECPRQCGNAAMGDEAFMTNGFHSG
jgi:hypothetical protein